MTSVPLCGAFHPLQSCDSHLFRRRLRLSTPSKSAFGRSPHGSTGPTDFTHAVRGSTSRRTSLQVRAQKNKPLSSNQKKRAKKAARQQKFVRLWQWALTLPPVIVALQALHIARQRSDPLFVQAAKLQSWFQRQQVLDDSRYFYFTMEEFKRETSWNKANKSELRLWTRVVEEGAIVVLTLFWLIGTPPDFFYGILLPMGWALFKYGLGFWKTTLTWTIILTFPFRYDAELLNYLLTVDPFVYILG